MPSRRTVAAIVLTAGFVAACSVSGGSPAPSSAAAAQGAASGVAGAVAIGTSSSATLGTILTGPNGMTLYTHAGDGPASSTCTDACAAAWPPVTVAAGGQPTAGAGVTGALATFKRADGSMQITWNGMPLYYWQSDAKPGDVTGNGVDGFSVAAVGGAAPMPSGAAPAPSVRGGYGY